MKKHASLFKALSDETRLRILALLLSEGELCVCDIIAALNLPQSTVSRHLAHLRNTELVNDRRCGLWIYYSINEENESKQELVSLLKKQLVDTDVAAADREILAARAAQNRCA
ncbi:metalloregulator ArsR/SmtB family transcription factor [Geomonas sp. RF6]|uniref:ArsR/SmtB family transcription factor n=1 Tax=Geomonas sp. RF6 TaxID=2897342 RepID=UPI001E49A72B|nr:metalloregulator ArsR/SmtB family transcription factor [Geomonas sp. RF6]UFS70614.1 metalloregulator ArsR/SmtB family transcription factor [Geomonas sp. RF6]